jgi:pimeloyl-ACP methyl ester carboxylesterase
VIDLPRLTDAFRLSNFFRMSIPSSFQMLVYSMLCPVQIMMPNMPFQLPGYGRSTPSKTSHDKRTIGIAVLETLISRLRKHAPTSSPIPVILCGHDRGSRICHRLAVDFSNLNNSPDLSEHQRDIFSRFELAATVFLDTVPDVVQYASFAKPSASVGTFHWPLLANVDLATKMISAYGGDKWCRDMHVRWTSSDPSGTGVKALEEDGALDHYGELFKSESVIRATCEDYAAGAGVDIQRQIQDQENNRKVDGRVLAIYSKQYLGARHDVESIWKIWTGEKADLKVVGIEGNYGHFLAEECPERVVAELKTYLGGFD